MNIQIANRLLEFRRANGYSQEELAEKLGVSRQAVSKWERAEASPDTDNIIALAALYGVTLDELINGKDEPCASVDHATNGDGESTVDDAEEKREDDEAEDEKKESVHVGFDGIHVEDGEDSVHVSWDGIHVDSRDGDHVHIDKNGVFVETSEGETVNLSDGEIEHTRRRFFWIVPLVSILSVMAFLLVGFLVKDGWSWSWIIFFAIPLIASLEEAIRKHRAAEFAYPVLATAAFLFVGMLYHVWHPTWVVFLTIPIFYIICDAIQPRHGKK